MMRVHHVAIQVPDLVAARAFYEGVLQLPVTREQVHAIWVDAGGVIVMLERCAESGGEPSTWASAVPGPYVVAFGIAAAERDSWRARLSAASVTLSHESAFTMYFRDPWGTRLALSHYPEPAP